MSLALDNRELAYLFGLSDFFAIAFEDPAAINSVLEANAIPPSETYSRFIQRTSGISLAKVQESLSSEIVLLVADTSKISGNGGNVLTVPDKLLECGFLGNRPFLSTETLESGIDFDIEYSGSSTVITFAKPVLEYAFARRRTASGEQLAIWASDVKIDEHLAYNLFGKLLKAEPEASSTSFLDFLYGLSYMYANGPTLRIMQKGLNLVLGVPLARQTDRVIDIRSYLYTDQYLVVTANNQYLLPFGLAPKVSIGDVIKVGDELATWVEVQDYVANGEWWINLHIPSNIIPELPNGQIDRHAVAGSHFDYLMRNYLKTHLFLVKVDVSTFKNVQYFSQIATVLAEAKPSYSSPIYVWSIEKEIEEGTVDDSGLGCQAGMAVGDLGYVHISRFQRDATDPLLRGDMCFTRMDISTETAKLIGENTLFKNITTITTLS